MQGYVTGGPRRLLQLEGMAMLIVSAWLYSRTGVDWVWFVALFLAPDLFMLGYLAGRRVGAVLYNFSHSYVPVLAVLTCGLVLDHTYMQAVGLIWGAHIGFDRMLGYGLKYGKGFGFTHLGLKGKAKAAQL